MSALQPGSLRYRLWQQTIESQILVHFIIVVRLFGRPLLEMYGHASIDHGQRMPLVAAGYLVHGSCTRADHSCGYIRCQWQHASAVHFAGGLLASSPCYCTWFRLCT